MADDRAQLELDLLLAEIARLRELVERLQAIGEPIPFEVEEELIRVENLVHEMVRPPTVQ